LINLWMIRPTSRRRLNYLGGAIAERIVGYKSSVLWANLGRGGFGAVVGRHIRSPRSPFGTQSEPLPHGLAMTLGRSLADRRQRRARQRQRPGSALGSCIVGTSPAAQHDVRGRRPT
jgi:hypothetical protein